MRIGEGGRERGGRLPTPPQPSPSFFKDHAVLRLASAPGPPSTIAWAPPGAGTALAVAAGGRVAVFEPGGGGGALAPPPAPADGGAWQGSVVVSGDARVLAAAWLSPPSPWRWPPAPPGAGVEARFGPDDARAACGEHWAGAGRLALAVVTEGGALIVAWACAGGGWATSAPLTLDGGPFSAADVVAAHDDALAVLLVPRGGGPVVVARVEGDPTAVDDGGAPLDAVRERSRAELACAPPVSRALFLPDAAGDSVLLAAGGSLARWDGGGGASARARWKEAASWPLDAAGGDAAGVELLAASAEGGAIARRGDGVAVAVDVSAPDSAPVALPAAAPAGAAFGPTGCAAAIACEAGVVIAAATGDAAGRLSWAAATGRAPADAALALAAAPAAARAAALDELATDVADQPWATRPGVWPAAARAALAAARAALAAGAAGPPSPEAGLEADLMTCLRVADVEEAARAAAAAAAADGARAVPNPARGATPSPRLRPADAAALAPAAAWAEATAARVLLAGRAWAASPSSPPPPGARLLASTSLLGGLRTVLTAAAAAPPAAAAAHDAALEAAGGVYRAWAASAPLADRLPPLVNALAAATAPGVPDADVVDAPGATAGLVADAAASFAGPSVLPMPLARVGGTVDPTAIAALFKARGPGAGLAAVAGAGAATAPPPPPSPFAPTAPPSSRRVAGGALPPLPRDMGAGALARGDADEGADRGRARRRLAASRCAGAIGGPPPAPALDALTWAPPRGGPTLASADGGAATADGGADPGAGGVAAALRGAWTGGAPVTGGRWFAV